MEDVSSNLLSFKSDLLELPKEHVFAPTPDYCPICYGSGFETVEGKGARPCVCRADTIRQKYFNRSVRMRPNGDFGEWSWLNNGFMSIRTNPVAMARLENIKAVVNGKSIGRGSQIMEMLERNVASSFYIHGVTGTYKTTIALALLQEAGRRGQETAYDIGRELIDTLRNHDLDQNKNVPDGKFFYSLAQLHTTEKPLCLLLDEIEDTAATLTGYTLSTLFRMIEKFKVMKQQLIVTSNRSLDSLLELWKYRDRQFLKGAAMAADYCEKIDRRMQEHCSILELVEV